jgi:ATP-dependent Clp protease ATP-binding subunit ClpC
LQKTRENKKNAITDENFNLAGELKKKEKEIKTEIKAVKKEKLNQKQKDLPKVDGAHIAHILSSRLSVDQDSLLSSDWDRIKQTMKNLEKHIIGQNHVLEKIKQKLHQAHLGLSDEHKPLASFLFAGPSGVGKTYTAKLLAKELYNDEKALLRLDMSEFSESHSTSKLLGSPAGYIGHQERNKFIENIRKRPYSVVLFDEFDKAHPDVRKLLLQILDDGQITDSTGKKLMFNHSVIILTTNVGADLYKNKSIGFGNTTEEKQILPEKHKEIHNSIKQSFGDAILSRLNSVCIFNRLSQKDIEQIVQKRINLLNEKLKNNKKIELLVDNNVLKILAEKNYSEDHGAREIEQKITYIIQELLVEKIEKDNKQNKYLLKMKGKKFQLV